MRKKKIKPYRAWAIQYKLTGEFAIDDATGLPALFWCRGGARAEPYFDPLFDRCVRVQISELPKKKVGKKVLGDLRRGRGA